MTRKTFTMSEEDYQALLESGKPVPYMIVGGYEPSSPQENANRHWQQLGEQMGFQWDTVHPYGSDPRTFTAMSDGYVKPGSTSIKHRP